jgi:transposase
LAASKKNARRLKATIGFLDESGLLMAPLLRRTWALRGQTPILRQRTRSRDKVSAVGVVTISPQRRRLGLYVALYPNTNVNAPLLVSYLRALRHHVHGPLILVWDRLKVHRARVTRAFLERCPQIHPVPLPPYAPELNAVEYVWGYLKGHPLANHAPSDAFALARTAIRHARVVAGQQRLLRGFVRATGLPLRLK